VKGSGAAIDSQPGRGACVEQSAKHSNTTPLPQACTLMFTRSFSGAPASHTSTRTAPSGVIAQPQETAVTFAAPQSVDPARPHRRSAGEMWTMVAEPQNRPAGSRPNCGGAVEGDDFRPWSEYFIRVIHHLAQNVGICLRWESSALTSLDPISDRIEGPTNSNSHVTAPLWEPLFRSPLPILHLFHHHFCVGPSRCGPLLNLPSSSSLWVKP
jgi:hypothetical protein